MSENRDLATLPLDEALDAYTPQLIDALPDNIPLNRFKRTVLTALNQTPELARCDRRSFFLACVKCAHDGLYPDGREAALVPVSGKVQYFPMIAGIRKRMRNSGDVLSATAEVVHKHDRFHYVKGDDPRLEHEPPALDEDRGPPVGAYAIIKLANGEILREVMGLPEIERIRAFSRVTRDDAPWKQHWGEMARKTVLRRCAKAAPISSDLDRLLARDDEAYNQMRALAPEPPRRADFLPEQPQLDPPVDQVTPELAQPDPTPPKRPRGRPRKEPTSPSAGGRAVGSNGPEDVSIDFERGELPGLPAEDPPEEGFEVINADGETIACDTLAEVEFEVEAALQEAGRRNLAAIEAVVENNKAVTDALPQEAQQRLSLKLAQLNGAFAREKLAEEQRAAAAIDPRQLKLVPDERASYEITPPQTGKGVPDYRTWWLAQFRPRLRKMTTIVEAARLVGDNEAHLANYKTALHENGQSMAVITVQKEIDDIMAMLSPSTSDAPSKTSPSTSSPT